MQSRARSLALPLLLAALFAAAGFFHLDEYGVTWDEALGDLFFGDRYLSYFITLDARYLAFGQDVDTGRVPDLSSSPFRAYPWEYYPFANTLAAATSRLFHALGILDPFDGFHALNLLLGAILTATIFSWMRNRYGELAALLAVVLLFLSPRIVGDAMVNTKDFPAMVLFSLASLALFSAWERAAFNQFVGSGVLLGFALATKANALFIPAIFMLLPLLHPLPAAWGATVRQRISRYLAAGLASGVLSLLTWAAVWPYAWSDPVRAIGSNLFYIATRKDITATVNTSSPLMMILFTTPPVFLILIAIGLTHSLALLRRDPAIAFLLTWIGVVLVRLHLPGAVNFDVVRHFLELFPPLAIIAAIGVRAMIAELPRRRFAMVAITIVASVSQFIAVARVHPFETAYWNRFTSLGLSSQGTAAAAERGIAQWGDYWAVTYRHGLRWLNANAPRDAVLIVPVAEHTVRLVAPLRLRSDIQLVRYATAEFGTRDDRRLVLARRLATQRPVFVMFVTRDDWANEMTDYCVQRLRPLSTWEVAEAPLLRIYRLQ